MIIVVGDTSGLLAALDDDHPDQSRARDVLTRAGSVAVSPVLLGELDHVARRLFGESAAFDVLEDIRHRVRIGRAIVPAITADMLDTAQLIRAKYRDLRLDLADAVNVVLAAQYRTNAILTLDHRDFRAVRPLTGHASFRVLPADEWPEEQA